MKNTLLVISLGEACYLYYMFRCHKSKTDFNLVQNMPLLDNSEWLRHLKGDEYGLRICPFGRTAIMPLIFILIGRNFVPIPQKYMQYVFGISFVLSLMNLNATVFLLPVWLIELLLMKK
tara:strand:+ start:223 stop:579 length:357 start_codon:yes stop_codon:yes gene_type:complete